MKIEYFVDSCENCSLVLIYGPNPADALTLKQALKELMSGSIKKLAIHELPGFSSINGCQLSAEISQRDIGLQQLDRKLSFECHLGVDTWEEIMELIEPFTIARKDDRNSFQYLDQSSGISLLISTSRTW